MNVLHVPIRDAIRTGSFGPFKIGASRHVISRMLGEVTVATLTDRKTSGCIWVYGTTEFHFANDLLTLIHCGNDDLFNGGPSLSIDPWKLRLHMPLSELLRILEGNNMRYNGCGDPHAAEYLVRLDSGFTMGFILDADAGLGPAGLRSWSIHDVG